MSLPDPAEFVGWQNYPLNLDISPLEVDAQQCNERLIQNADRLFVSKGSVGVLEFGPWREDGTREVDIASIETSPQLGAILRKPYTSWVFFINQSNSWSQMEISEGLFRKLFTRLRVHPGFLELVHLFSEKVRPVEQSYNHLFAHLSPRHSSDPSVGNDHLCGYEIGYNLKYVAPHGRDFPNDPFSIRETAIYHKFCCKTQESTWIFLQASDGLKDRLRGTYGRSNDAGVAKQLQMHASIFLSTSEHWRDYLIYLENYFSDLADRGFYTNIRGPQLEGDIEVDFSDIRKLQILTDKLEMLAQLLQLNIDLSAGLKRAFNRVRTASSSELSLAFDTLELGLDQFAFQQQTHRNRVKAIISRAGGIRSLVQNILDIRATESSKQINLEMQKLTEQGVNENKYMKILTLRTTQDTRLMKVIALITAVFLPATFLGTLFGSNFFAYSSDKNKLVAASNVWIYALLSVALSGVTVPLWFWWRAKVMSRQGEESELEKLTLVQ